MSSADGTTGSREASREPLMIYERVPRTLRRRELNAFAESVCEKVAGGRRFCCLLTNDAALRRMNRQFLSIDAPTDVLSFPTEAPGGALGDIAISVDRACEQAVAYGHDLPTELRVLLLHGVLHLLRHDHASAGGKMRRVEARWRRQLGLPAGVIERVAGKHAARKPAVGGRQR
jgi:probable rRNA maturation factor